jgi:hypothetical protein
MRNKGGRSPPISVFTTTVGVRKLMENSSGRVKESRGQEGFMRRWLPSVFLTLLVVGHPASAIAVEGHLSEEGSLDTPSGREYLEKLNRQAIENKQRVDEIFERGRREEADDLKLQHDQLMKDSQICKNSLAIEFCNSAAKVLSEGSPGRIYISFVYHDLLVVAYNHPITADRRVYILPQGQKTSVQGIVK